MQSVSNQPDMQPVADRQPMCDGDILRLLADQRGRAVSEIAAHFRVTPTAIRNRLLRLADGERVVRRRKEAGPGSAAAKRGRPQFLYFLTDRGAEELTQPEN